MKKMTVFMIALALFVAPLMMGSTSYAKPIVLKWTTFEPDVPGATTEMVRRFASLTEEKTEGRVKVKPYWGGVLGKVNDFLKMIGGSGVADGGFVVTTYSQWEVPLWAAGGLPFNWSGYRIAPQASWALYKEWPTMQEEWKKVNVKPLWAFTPHPYYLGLKKSINTMDDLKGQKITSFGYNNKIVEQFGISNITLGAPQTYDALGKGVIEGLILPYHTFKIFRNYEYTKYLVDFSFIGGTPMNTMAINVDVWNKILPKDQKAIEEIAAGMHDWFVAEMDKETKTLDAFYKNNGVEIIKFSPEEQARIIELCTEPVWSDWLATATKQGVPGEEFLNRYRAKISELSK